MKKYFKRLIFIIWIIVLYLSISTGFSVIIRNIKMFERISYILGYIFGAGSLYYIYLKGWSPYKE